MVEIVNPVGGQVLSAPYSGQVTFAAPPVRAPGLPNSASMILPAGKPETVTVSVTNNGAGTQDVFLDPRTRQRQAFSLLSPGQRGKLALTITPSGRKGRTVRGTLFVDVFSNALDLGGELVALPYEYTVG